MYSYKESVDYNINFYDIKKTVHLSFYRNKFNREELNFIYELIYNLDESNLEILKTLEKKQHEPKERL